MKLPELLQDLKIQVKIEEDNYGHKLGPDDIGLMWQEMMCKRAVQHMRLQVQLEKDGNKLPEAQQQELQLLEKRLKKYQAVKRCNQQRDDMLHAIGRVKQNVARKTALSSEEEKIRCKLQWQDHDWTLQMCSLDKEELKHHVC